MDFLNITVPLEGLGVVRGLGLAGLELAIPCKVLVLLILWIKEKLFCFFLSSSNDFDLESTSKR